MAGNSRIQAADGPGRAGAAPAPQEAAGGPQRAGNRRLGWDSVVEMRFQGGPETGWRIVAPAEMPAYLAVAGWLEPAPGGGWQSGLFRVPPSGLKRKMREHCERALIGVRKRIRAAERAGKGTEQ